MPSTRDFTPRGLVNRSALILFVPVLAILLGMTWYYYDYHIHQMDRTLTQHVGRDMATFVETYEAAPGEFERLQETYARLQDIEVTQTADCSDAIGQPVARDLSEIRLNLADILDRDFLFEAEPRNGLIRFCIPFETMPSLVFEAPRKRLLVINSHIFIVWVLLLGVLLTVVAYGFLRNQVRSILRLAEAAKAFGRGRDVPDFKPSGASEVREAARAVINMKNRLTSFAQQRTAMLAGVSHDLRTPLTRLKLQFAMMDETDDIKDMRRDLADMEAMLDEYLAFAKGEDGEAPVEVDVADLVRDVVESFGSDALEADINCAPVITAREISVQRALTNLIQNALEHAETVKVSLHDGPRWLDILVDDDGPGIDKDAREEALQPFSRLDAARSQNKAGAGLGLAITRDAATLHGGDLRLEDSPMGGLRARLRLPH